MPPQFPDRCLFGLASMQGAASARQPLMEYVRWLGERAEVQVSTRFLDSYAEFAAAVREGDVDVAWLPPVVYVALERTRAVVAMVSNHRAGQAAFHGVLLVRAFVPIHTLDGIQGMRVAWVDPCSASGYVMPRIQLAALGIDPRKAFTQEIFAGSHDAAVRAVVSTDADLTATFARVDGAGNVTAGSWSHVPEIRGQVRVLWTFGGIPSDVIAARASYSGKLRDRLADAFVASTNEVRVAPLARRLFGVEEFRRGHMKSYASLRRAVERASAASLIDALPLGTL